jgi:hypothetical protein
MFKPGDKVVVFQPDGEELRGVVILTETLTSGVKVRVRSGHFISNVDEKQVAKGMTSVYQRIPYENYLIP